MTSLNINTLEDIADNLKQSPLFHLSLTSKELFHSNFLAWLCTIYPEQTAQLFAPYLKTQTTELKITEVYRELFNVDLTLKFSNNKVLIIENKVKSLPYLSQLEKIAEAVKDKTKVSFLLLSLTEPGFLESSKSTITLKDDTVWHYANYQTLANGLINIQVLISHASNYHGQILADYIGFIQSLHLLQEYFRVDYEDENTDFFAFLNALKPIKNLRMHDFIYKLRYAQLAHAVAIRLGFEVSQGNWVEGKTEQVFISSGMSNGTGFFDFKYLVNDRESQPAVTSSLGVQFQGNAFRIVFEYLDPDNAFKIAEALAGSRLWFDFELVSTASAIYPRKGGFNQFKGVFLYRSKNLDKISTKHLVDLIVKYALLAKKNSEQVVTEIKKVTGKI